MAVQCWVCDDQTWLCCLHGPQLLQRPLTQLHGGHTEGLQVASWVLQGRAQVGHHGSRQLAATEIQGGQCGILLERCHQVLEGFLGAGLLHPGGTV